LFFAPLGLASTYIGLIMAYASLGVPFVVTTVGATLQGINYNLVRASLSLGSNPVKTFFSHHAAVDCAGRDLWRSVRVCYVIR
jgi:putative spermidine/putrescine transport system permease protein